MLEELAQLKRVKQKEEKECLMKMDELSKELGEVKLSLAQHNRIMSDIKPLLKQMARYGDNTPRLQEYSKTYNRFSEMCQSLLRCLSNQVMMREEFKFC